MADPIDRIRELEQQIERLSLFHEVGKAVASTLDLQKVLETIMSKISDFLRPDTWALLMLDEKSNELHYEMAAGATAASLKEVRVRLGEGIGGWVAEHGEVVLIEDVTKEPRFGLERESWYAGARSIVCVPVKGRGRVLGAIELVNTSMNQHFHEDDIPILANLADYAAIALENARYVQRIHELTITDDCTALYNARHLNFVLDAEIYRSIRYGYEFSVIFIDLDHFKQVNDTHGHLLGSKLLWQLGDHLGPLLRDVIGRPAMDVARVPEQIPDLPSRAGAQVGVEARALCRVGEQDALLLQRHDVLTYLHPGHNALSAG